MSIVARVADECIRTEMAEETLDWPGGGVTQCADGSTFDLFAARVDYVIVSIQTLPQK